ncbi:MAG: HlyD family secretion protein [Kiloniellaceae bacterium]
MSLDETDDKPDSPPGKNGRKRAVLLGLALLALCAGGYEGYDWWANGRFEVSTDDAYLGADISVLAAKVSGHVVSVEVDENQAVKTGDVIARIDDGDYRLAVRSAKDKIAAQQATVARIAVQAEAAEADVTEARAQVASAEADLERTSLELARQSKLEKSNFASRQVLDNARTGHDKAVADVNAAKAGLAASKANVAVLQAQRVEAERALQGLRTDLAQAERDLSFTVVRAPIDGVVGNKSVEVGQLVQEDTRIAAIVPLDDVYIDANFKETQLADMQPGQSVHIEVDAYPGRDFVGRVDSIAPAAGALFSLLPPENATGNFTKIVQRLPVRIRLPREAVKDHVLRPGMSVVVTVDTRTTPVAMATLPPPPGADDRAAKPGTAELATRR